MIFNKILHTLINLLAQKSLQLGIRLKIGVPRFVSRHKMLFRLKSLFRWAEIFCCPMNSFSWWGCCDRRQQSCLQQIDKLLVKNFTKQKVFSLSTRIIICHNFGQISVSENFAQKEVSAASKTPHFYSCTKKCDVHFFPNKYFDRLNGWKVSWAISLIWHFNLR